MLAFAKRLMRGTPARRTPPARRSLRVEALEDRVTPATYSTMIDLASSANPSPAGSWVGFTATLSAVGPFGWFTPPSGARIQFTDNGSLFGSGTTDFSGTVNVVAQSLSPGSHTIMASFAGGSPNGFDFYQASSGSLAQTVGTAAPPRTPISTHVSAEGARPGSPGTLTAFNPDGKARFATEPFGAGFTGGVRVGVGDVNADGVEDVVAGAGPGGGPVVKVYDGDDGSLLHSFMAYDATFTGGIYVAAGDLNGDGFADIVTSPDRGGGPRVRVISGKDFSPLADFLGIDDAGFRGGARVAVGDVNADGWNELIVSAGFMGGPRIAVFDGTTIATTRAKLVNDFFAFEPELRNGAFVAVGDVNADGFGDLVFGAGPDGGPRVRVISGKELYQGGQQVDLANFFAGDVNNRDGVYVATGDADGDGDDEIIALPPVGVTGTDGPGETGLYQGGVYDAQGTPLPEYRAPGGYYAGIPVAAPPPTDPGNPGGTSGIVGTYRGTYNTTVKGENGAPFPGRVSGTLTVTITGTEPHPAGGLRLSGTVSYTDFPDGPRTRPMDPAYSRFMPATGAVEILADDAPDGHSGGTGSVWLAGILNGNQIPIDTGGASFGIRSDPWSTALHEAFVLTRS